MVTKATVRLFVANPAEFDAAAMLKKLDARPTAQRYLARSMHRRLYAIPFPDDDGIGLWMLRHDAPDVHEDGEIKPWDLPGEVAEGSYFQFYDDGVVSMVATGHGPRTTSLSAYLDEITKDDVVFDPIVRGETDAHVASLDQVKRIEFVLTGESVQVLRQIDPTLGEAVDSVASATGATKLGIVLDGVDTDARDTMWSRMKTSLRSLASSDDLHRFRKAKVVVRGELAGEEEVDLLKDRVAYQIGVPAAGISQANAFTVLRSAYDRYHADFTDAG